VDWSIVIVAADLLGVAAVSRWLTGTPVTPAMVVVAVGVPVGPQLLGAARSVTELRFLDLDPPR
jgi:hypothetical protein